jgi:two-component system LytT family response regulator
MRALIVDDEPLARKALEQALMSRDDIERLDSAEDVVEALSMLEEEPYDVLLLDIEMPEQSGIELVASLNKKRQPLPAIIFVTAHDEHAIAAFESHAVDYILKPFSEERIHEALNIASQRSESERAARLIMALPELGMLLRKSSKIAIKAKGRILFIDPTCVALVQAQGNYVLLQSPQGSYLLRESISDVAEKLKLYGFIRIHRSTLVNSAFVEEIQPWPTGEYILRIKGGKELTVSRTYKKNLSSIAQFWVGTESFSQESFSQE